MTFRSVTVSAPSKLILHGEHSVVYDKTALAGSLDLRTRMRIASKKDVIEVDFPDIGIRQSWKASEVREAIFDKRPREGLGTDVDDEQRNCFLGVIHAFLGVDEDNLVMASLICFFYLYATICKDDVVPMSIKVESEIPIGAGLGSSAALSVCLAAGLRNIVRQIESKAESEENLDLEEISRLAYLSEKILHGTPSGVDNSVSAYGGIIKYVAGQVTVLKEVPKLRILLINTNVSRNTKQLVQKVREQFIAMPRVVRTLMEAVDSVSLASLRTLEDMAKNGDTQDRYKRLEQLIDYNQKLLEALNVSHTALEDVVGTVAEFGLHAKLTGAGGGGFAFALIPPYVQEKSVSTCKETLLEKGYTCWETDLGVTGVKLMIENR